MSQVRIEAQSPREWYLHKTTLLEKKNIMSRERFKMLSLETVHTKQIKNSTIERSRHKISSVIREWWLSTVHIKERALLISHQVENRRKIQEWKCRLSLDTLVRITSITTSQPQRREISGPQTPSGSRRTRLKRLRDQINTIQQTVHSTRVCFQISRWCHKI